jgi:hypothetical protein
MGFTIQGIGTAFVGKRDFDPDGSYVTTKWFVILYVPIFPIESLRIEMDESHGRVRGTIMSMTTTYEIQARAKLNWIQVCCVYGFVYGTVAWYYALEWISATRWKVIPNWLGVILMVVPFFVPFLLRAYARRRMWLRYARQIANENSQV